tara:strand:- start:556 stop:837 length:282 start_codon:yes stop_codon:yes gene_type:complete
VVVGHPITVEWKMQRHLLYTKENNKIEGGMHDIFKINIDVSNNDRYHLWIIETVRMDCIMNLPIQIIITLLLFEISLHILEVLIDLKQIGCWL